MNAALRAALKSRLRAALIHFSGSVCLGLVSLALVFWLWYPGPLAAAVGVGPIFLLMLAVDVCIGPLLTFAVFKVGKKSLPFDLAVIVLLQLGALGYGLWSIADGRPAWLVFNVDRFTLTRVNDIDLRHAPQARPEYRSPPWTGPRWVASAIPDDQKDRNKLVFESVAGGPDLPQRPDLYQPLETQADNIRSRVKPLSELEKFNAVDQVRKVTAAWPQADAWLPFATRTQSMVVLIDKAQAKPVAIVELQPWP
jgi:hypothetical protein